MIRNDLVAIAYDSICINGTPADTVIDAIIDADMRDEDGDLLTDIDGYIDEIVAEARDRFSQR